MRVRKWTFAVALIAGCGVAHIRDVGTDDDDAGLDATSHDASMDAVARGDAPSMDAPLDRDAVADAPESIDADEQSDSPDTNPPDAWAADAFEPPDASELPDAFELPDAVAMADVFVAPDAFEPPDAYTIPDAYTVPDAFEPPDAFVPDAYVPDAGPPILFQDDFDDATYTDDWILVHGSATQSGGQLTSGPSCMWTGHCPFGPMLLMTRDLLPVGDGRITFEYDVFTGVNFRYENRFIVDLHAEVLGGRIGVNGDGSTRNGDPMLRSFWHMGGTEAFQIYSAEARSFRADPVVLQFSDDVAADNTWYHVEVSFCGASGMRYRITDMGGGVVRQGSSAFLNASIPASVTQVYGLVWMEGGSKAIDNLVIYRGCPAF